MWLARWSRRVRIWIAGPASTDSLQGVVFISGMREGTFWIDWTIRRKGAGHSAATCRGQMRLIWDRIADGQRRWKSGIGWAEAREQRRRPDGEDLSEKHESGAKAKDQVGA